MANDTWERMEDLFFAALERPEEERASFLQSACADPGQRMEVAELLAAHASATGAPLAIERILRQEPEPSQSPVLAGREGMRVGIWRLERLLGSGGMGEVWSALRTGSDFEQRVAVKLIRPVWSAEPLAARFRRERQTLARLRHPNIAALIDGGVTSDQVPFLAMEYVDGVPITDFCRARSQSLAERLRLFRVVCEAVRFAHANLVIHRDLKPQNILVTTEGRPVLLDFGIAKLLLPDEQGNEETRFEERLLTPDYAAPEQLRGEAASTRSDVWALGALLFELLTDVRLRDTDRAPTTARKPRGVGPAPRPSRHGAVPWVRRLAGDLDAVAGRALHLDPERRYRSVEQLIEDLDRYLGARPVLARPDSIGYRARKWAERNRAAAVLGPLVVVLLGVLGISSALQARDVARQRDAAVAARADTERSMAMLIDLFGAADPRVTPGGDTLRVVELLARAERALELEPPHLSARLWGTLTDIHEARYDQAAQERTLARGIAAAEKAGLGEELLTLRYREGKLARGRDGRQAALPLFRRSLEEHEAHYGKGAVELAPVLQDLASTVEPDQEAMELLARALAIRRASPTEDDGLAAVLNEIGIRHHAAGRLTEARGALVEARGLLAREHPVEYPPLLSVSANLAACAQAMGAFEEAERVQREVLEARRRVYGSDSYVVGASHLAVGVALAHQGRFDAATAAMRQGVDIVGRHRDSEHHEYLFALRNLAGALARGDHPVEALGLYRTVIARYDGTPAGTVRQLADLRLAELEARALAGQAVSAARVKALIDSFRAGEDAPGSRVAERLHFLGALALLEPGQLPPGAAERVFEEASAIVAERVHRDHPLTAQAGLGLLVARRRAGSAIDRGELDRHYRVCEAWGLANRQLLALAREELRALPGPTGKRP